MSILLVPTASIKRDIVEALKNCLGGVFRTQILVCEELPEPKYAFNQERKQYLSSAILRWMGQQKEYRDYDKALGVVDLDLYVPGSNFVFGEASERVAVFSLARLRQEFYGLPGDKSLFHKRALTEAVHELGHSHRLGHCGNPHCVMYFSNSLRDTDRKGTEFCTRCHDELEWFIHAARRTAPARKRRAPHK